MPVTDDIRRRLAGLAIAGAAAAPLLLVSTLRPSGEGHGTHTQLGLPACGWVVAFDAPCPTCGMTTAYAHAARGDLVSSFVTQPMGALLAVGTAAAFWAGVHVLATGVRLERVLAGMLAPRTLWMAAGVTALAWVYKLVTW